MVVFDEFDWLSSSSSQRFDKIPPLSASTDTLFEHMHTHSQGQVLDLFAKFLHEPAQNHWQVSLEKYELEFSSWTSAIEPLL